MSHSTSTNKTDLSPMPGKHSWVWWWHFLYIRLYYDDMTWTWIPVYKTDIWCKVIYYSLNRIQIHVNWMNLNTRCTVYLRSRKALNGHRNWELHLGSFLHWETFCEVVDLQWERNKILPVGIFKKSNYLSISFPTYHFSSLALQFLHRNLYSLHE
jgi:hypothetical protein